MRNKEMFPLTTEILLPMVLFGSWHLFSHFLSLAWPRDLLPSMESGRRSSGEGMASRGLASPPALGALGLLSQQTRASLLEDERPHGGGPNTPAGAPWLTCHHLQCLREPGQDGTTQLPMGSCAVMNRHCYKLLSGIV